MPARGAYASTAIGRGANLPVGKRYADRSPFVVRGQIENVAVDIQRHLDAVNRRAVDADEQHGMFALGIGA